jgi:hypothetical protein
LIVFNRLAHHINYYCRMCDITFSSNHSTEFAISFITDN